MAAGQLSSLLCTVDGCPFDFAVIALQKQSSRAQIALGKEHVMEIFRRVIQPVEHVRL